MDQFSGDETADDTDHQKLHDTILSIEKSLEELPESPSQSIQVENKSSDSASVIEGNVNLKSSIDEPDRADEQPPEQESMSALVSDSDLVTGAETNPKGGHGPHEAVALGDEGCASPLKDLSCSSPMKTGIAVSDEVRSSNMNTNAVETAKSPEKFESPKKNKLDQQVTRSPAMDEAVANDDSKSPGKDYNTPAASGSPEKSQETQGEHNGREKCDDSQKEGDHRENNTSVNFVESPEGSCIPPTVLDAPERSETLQKGEGVNEERRTPAKEAVVDEESKNPVDAPGFGEGSQEFDASPESPEIPSPEFESFSETGSIHQNPGDTRMSSPIGNEMADSASGVYDSKSIEEYHVSPKKRSRLSSEKAIVKSSIANSDGDKILRRNKKAMTPPKESHSLPKKKPGRKKRGRPSFAEQQRKSLGNLPENVDKTSKPSTIESDDITCQSDKSTTSVKKKDRKVLYRRPREIDNPEDISLFLPDGWIFLGTVRQQGNNAGHIDMYYMTPPPRIKLRSRQELVAYMQKHDLNYDPLNFFVRGHLTQLIERGDLVYYDSKNVVTPETAANEALMAQLVKGNRGTGSDAQTESTGKSDGRKSEASIDTKIRTERKSLPLKRKSFKKEKITPVKASPKITRAPIITKSDAVSPEPAIRKTRERNLGSATRSQAEPQEEPTDMITVEIKTEVTSPDNMRKTRLRSSTSGVESPAASLTSPVKALKRSSQVLEKVEPDPPPKTPIKKRMGRPRKKPRTPSPEPAPSPPSSPAPSPPPSPPQSDTNFDQRVVIQAKPKIVRSPYFSSSSNMLDQPKSLAGRRRDKDSDSAPPRSPFNLIQEDLFHDPWQMLIATIFLNSTSGRIAIPLALEFLKRWPTPQEACQAKLYDILDVIEPIGFGRTRAAIIIRFSHEFLTKDWTLPSDLYGIGKYGTDSYKIFCMKNAWKRVESDDPMLMMYLNWRRATEHLRKKFLNSRKNSKAVDPDETALNQDQIRQSMDAYQSRQTKQAMQAKQTQTDLPLPRKRTRTK